MRLMFDSTTATDIPPGSELVAGYVDGARAWSARDWDRFPGRTLVRICAFNDRLDAQMIDIQPGNNDAQGVVPWVRAKWVRGQVPTAYCFSDAGPAGYRISDVRAACDAAGVRRPLFVVAEWDNDPSTFDPQADPEIVAKQYANPALTGGHYDASVVADYWPGIDGGHAMKPRFVKQGVDSVVMKVGDEPIVLDAAWDWGNGPRNIPAAKVYATEPCHAPLVVYPPADPDADPTLVLNAQPAVFVITVNP